MSAPDYVEPIVGWRVWRVGTWRRTLRLYSTLYDEIWEPGHALRAVCLRRHGMSLEPAVHHAAPSSSCACGLYAGSSPAVACAYLLGREDPPFVSRVVGQVALWGNVIEATRGWRASCAYPVRVWIPARRTAPIDLIAAAVEAYGVDVELLSSHRSPDVVDELVAA